MTRLALPIQATATTVTRCAVGALFVAIALGARLPAAPPNIVLIVADDLGYGDLGCYGSEVNRTPNIDRLAEAGLRFTDFHSAGPMCTPTRAAMLTGRYQQRFGARFDGPLSGAHDRDLGLPEAAYTIAEHLRTAGYATGCFGKWHLGFQRPYLPTDQGFDVFCGLTAGDGDHHTHVNRYGEPDWWVDGELQAEEGYTAELLTKHSIAFIEARQEEPFFLYVPHLAIHFPWQGPHDPPHREVGKNYEDDKWGVIPDPRHVAPHVSAMVEAFDRSVGEIVAALERLQLDERTVVIVTSDNGGYLTYGERFANISSNGPLRGQKGSLYEGGHRVPLIFYWPSHATFGVTPRTAHSVDLFPTIAALAEAPIDGLSLDGVDLEPLLFGGWPLDERALYWRADEDRAVRRGDWKLKFTDDAWELFDLASDLEESDDVAAEYPTVVARTLSRLGGLARRGRPRCRTIQVTPR